MKKSINWFSLIELLVVISVIWIVIFWASKINFNPQIDKQNSLLFLNNIFTTIEKIRNDSLFGKWVWTNLSYPDKWIISLARHRNLNISYLSWTNNIPYTDFHINYLNNLASIEKLTCKTLDNSLSSTTNNIEIEITWSNLTLSWCTSPNQKILEITTKYKNFENIIKLNTVSWVIEKF